MFSDGTKLFDISWEEEMNCSCCAGTYYNAIVRAVTKEEALGFFLEEFPSAEGHSCVIELFEIQYGEVIQL